MKAGYGSQWVMRSRAYHRLLTSLVEEHELTWEQLDVLSSITLIQEFNLKESVLKTTLYSFMRMYISHMTKYMIRKYMKQLSEKTLLWIEVKHISVTDLGIKIMKDINTKTYNYDKGTINPLVNAMKNGVVNKKGYLIPERSMPRRTKNPYNPYLGVHKLQNGRWGAYVKPNHEEIFVGDYSRAVYAAKARDRYIEKNKLKLPKSLKYK